MKNLIKSFALSLCICNCAIAQQGWYVVPNAPVTDRFEDVSFVGATGWIAENNYAGAGVIIHKSLDAGDTWTIMDTIAPYTDYARAVEFINDSIGFIGMLWSGVDSAMFRTTDGGNTFSLINSPVFANLEGVCGMAHYGNTVIGVGIFSGQQNFYKSTDAGLTWTVAVLDTLVYGLVDCYMFNDSVYVISGQAATTQYQKACILKTFDGGDSWQIVALSTVNFAWCWKMSFIANGKGCASIAASNKIFLTADSGTTWVEQFVGNCVASADDFGGTTFLNDSLGWMANQYDDCFFETRDGGINWTGYSFGYAIDRMAVLDSQTVVAVGQTVYKYNIDSLTSINNPVINVNRHQLKLKPNPVSEQLFIEVELKYNTRAQISVLNSARQLVKNIANEILKAGSYSFIFNTKDLAQGTYIVYVSTHQEHISEKFQILH